MRRMLFAVLLGILCAALAAAQQVYPPRLLRTLGLQENQITEITRIQDEAAKAARLLQADQEIKKAELARLLLEGEPDMRQVERNLRDSAEIDVRLRLLEINRELAIRKIIGIEAWTRLMEAARNQRLAAAGEEFVNQAMERLRVLGQSISEQQRRITEELQRRGDVDFSDIQERLRQLQDEFTELQRQIRERLQ